jgi:hypothetical protein
MRDRRHFLAILAGCLAVPKRLLRGTGFGFVTAVAGPGRAEASPQRSAPVVTGLLGDNLMAGSTGRLCIFGANLADVAMITFPSTPISVRLLTTSENEITIDCTVPENTDFGNINFSLKDKFGENYAFDDPTVTIVESADYYPTPGFNQYGPPSWPGTPGWPQRQSGAIEQYYNERPPVTGIGGDLL